MSEILCFRRVVSTWSSTSGGGGGEGGREG
jgi:hypothetical protein